MDLKLKAVTKGLQSWSDRNVGHINSQLTLAREILHQFEIAKDSHTLSPGEAWLKNNLKKHSLALASLQRTIAQLLSRIGWLRDRDANTKLFQLDAQHKKRKNLITRLVADGQIYTNHEDKARIVDDFYEGLLGTCMDREYTIILTELGSMLLTWLILSSHSQKRKFGQQLSNYLQTKLQGQPGLQVAFTILLVNNQV